MGLLKTVFEVNLGLFLKDKRCFFLIFFWFYRMLILIQYHPPITPFLCDS